MTQAKEKPMPYTDVQRMELRSYANLAGEVVARLWPMRTFISRNPLQGLESLSFDKAVSRGEELFSGRGYLSSEAYRDAFRSGRIQQRHLDEVLRSLDSGKEIVFGDRRLSHLDLLRAAMVHGVQPSSSDRSAPAGSGSPREDATSLAQLTQWITAILKSDVLAESESLRLCEPDEWPYRETMATWCDRTIGTDLDDQINRQLIKWSAAFCDEGEATWSMPRREGTFFRAWKTAAQHDLSLSLLGIDRASEKISALSDRPEDALLESLERLKVPTSAWEEYLSRHVAALPGWAGFIKWRAEQTAYPWQEAYRIDLVKYLAVRLFYERELVDVSCRNSLNCSGNIEAIQDYARRFPHAVWFRR
ncbi:MAG: Na-translocating system protein MpsB, partial [Nitrospirota bacterium]|nr:Na-translocating system protein MpsB [Nitrospirota bacterium]